VGRVTCEKNLETVFLSVQSEIDLFSVIDFFIGICYHILVMKIQLSLNRDKAPKSMTPYEEEIIESLSSGDIILEVLPVYDMDSITKRVYIFVQNENGFSVQANLDADGNLFQFYSPLQKLIG
jgi:hypothetical protein